MHYFIHLIKRWCSSQIGDIYDMRTGWGIVALFWVLIIPVNGQLTTTVDSLQQVLRAKLSDSERVSVLRALSEEWSRLNIDSSLYYAQRAYRAAVTVLPAGEKADACFTLAYAYVTANDLDSAGMFYHEAAAHYEQAGNTLEQTRCIMLLGNIALAKGEYFDALQQYEACLPVAREENLDELLPHLNNNIGVIFLELGDYDDALPYLETAAEMFERMGDEYNAAYTSSNIAYIYYQKGQDEDALDRYLSIVPRHLKEQRWTDLASVYNQISSIHLSSDNLLQAKEYNRQAISIIENNPANFRGPSSLVESKIYLTSAQVAYRDGNTNASKKYARRSLSLALPNSFKAYILQNASLLGSIYFEEEQHDSAAYYMSLYIDKADVLEDGQEIAEVTKLRLQNEFANQLREAEIQNLKRTSQLEQRQTILIASVVVALMLIAVLVLLFINQKKKVTESRLRRKNLQLEQKQLKREVEYKNKELALNMMYLAEKNELITRIGKEMEALKSDAKRENRQVIQQVINQLRHNSDEGSWEEFELRFKEVHREFYEALNSTYPGLTPNEKRLCAFLRMNMTTKEISALTHQSTKSINMARFRLRKKMGMEHDQNLISFLANL